MIIVVYYIFRIESIIITQHGQANKGMFSMQFLVRHKLQLQEFDLCFSLRESHRPCV
jgi:hypothetical protein